MFSPVGTPLVLPEADLCTKMAVIAAIDPTFDATVSEVHHQADAFSVDDWLMGNMTLRECSSLHASAGEIEAGKKESERAQK